MDQALPIPADGPYYDDLHSGLVFVRPTAVTLDSGLAVAYQAVSGDSLPMSINQPLCQQVTGRPELLVNPGLVFTMSIGASTVATKRVVANLFYRNMVLREQIFLGQTIETTTQVAGLADASLRPGKPPRGKALLSISSSINRSNRSTDSTADDVVLDYQRCALIPCRGDALPGHDDDVGSSESEVDLDRFLPSVPNGWNLDPLGPHDQWDEGETRYDQLRDVVDNATALVRLSHNVAAVHRDAEVSQFGRRLVYGGHTVALAQASLVRTLAGMATVLGWQSCNHLAPVFEQDILSCRHTLLGERSVAIGTVRAIRVEVAASRNDENNQRIVAPVLDWVVVVLST